MQKTRNTRRPQRATASSGAPTFPGAALDSVERAIAAIRAGQMVVVADDDSRENEGDLIIAAERVTETAINFMATHGRGLICVALPRLRLQQLGIGRMPVKGAGSRFQTAFMESVDAAAGVTTGISARDRAATVAAILSEQTGPQDLVSPGHLFPLEAVEGGVLRRPGHTEAAVDLARLAGLKPGGVICEILRDDGEMARLPELRAFAQAHGLCMTTVAALIEYRRKHESLVELVREVALPTEWGEFRLRLYRSSLGGEQHVALIRQQSSPEAPLVRLHSECLTGDVFGSLRCDCGQQVRTSLRMIAEGGGGALIYLRQEGRGIGLENKIHAYALQDAGMDTVEANVHLGFEADLRSYDEGAQILADLGLRRIRLITNNPGKVAGLIACGIEIVERVPLVCSMSPHNERYMKTKKDKLGHVL